MEFKIYKGELRVEESSIKNADVLKLYKDLGFKYLLYVYYYKDLSKKNPLRDLPYTHKQEESKLRAFGSKKFKIPRTNQAKVNRAIAGYETLVTEQEREIYTYDKKMDQFGMLLNKTAPRIEKNTNINTGIITYSTNIDIINSILNDITNIIQAKMSLISLYVQGSIPKHLRGRLSPLSTGKIKT